MTMMLLVLVLSQIIVLYGYCLHRHVDGLSIRSTRRRMCEATTDPVAAPVDPTPSGEDTSANLPQVTWRAAAKGSVTVKENSRTVDDYMALPASEYSVLSADQIERLSDSQFKCVLPTMNFFGTKICPILYVDVVVYPEDARAEIIVNRAETTGSDMALKVNGTFNISAINIVSAGVDGKGRKTLNSNTTLKIDVVVPSTKLPTKVIESGGNFLMQQSLNIIVPTFVRILRADFNRWSSGVNDRSAVDGAKLG
jgi:hypothetical protein